MTNQSAARRMAAAIGLAAICAAPLGAQATKAKDPQAPAIIRGQVRDELNHQTMHQVGVSLLDFRDTAVAGTMVNDSGKFSFRIKPGTYSVDLHHIGYVRTTTTPFNVVAGDTVDLKLEMAANTVTLDTVTTKEALKPKGLFALTPGQEYVRQHYILGLGKQISWFQIEKAKKSLSGYLGSLDGFKLTGSPILNTPVLPAQHGQFLMSTAGSGCLYANVDRWSMLYVLMQNSAETMDDMLKLTDIVAVEVFRTKQEIPAEWGNFGISEELFTRRNSGMTYTIGHTGVPPIQASSASGGGANQLIDEDALIFGTAPVDRTTFTGHYPACGFVQIWTGAAYRDHPNAGGH